MLFFVSWRNKCAIIEWPLFDAPTSSHGVFTSFSLSRCCCLHFCRNKFGLMLAQGCFKGQRSSIFTNCIFFMTLCDMQSSSGTQCAIKYPWCLYCTNGLLHLNSTHPLCKILRLTTGKNEKVYSLHVSAIKFMG